jgi:hypothetical protein
LSLNDLGNNPIPDIFNADAGGCPTVCAFNNNLLTAFLPLGSSIYHGLQSSLTRRMNNGLTFQASYTWSRTIDNSTADFHSTDLTPRRPQDFQNIAGDRSVSALSRTHRLTIAAVYDLPFFNGGNWLEKNVLGNWQFSPVYTYESPEWATPQSGVDSNLNIDNAGDRVILNPNGTGGVEATSLHCAEPSQIVVPAALGRSLRILLSTPTLSTSLRVQVLSPTAGAIFLPPVPRITSTWA